jgi:hypothetical protein
MGITVVEIGSGYGANGQVAERICIGPARPLPGRGLGVFDEIVKGGQSGQQ